MLERHWYSEPLRSFQFAAWIAMTVSSASAKVGTDFPVLPRAPRVVAAGDRAGVVERALAGHGEGDDGVSAEPEAGGSVVDAHALGPGLVEAAVGGGPDQKAEAEPAAAVAVAAGGVDVLDEGGGEHEGSNFHFSFLVRLQGRVEKQCAPVMRGTPKSVFLSES